MTHYALNVGYIVQKQDYCKKQTKTMNTLLKFIFLLIHLIVVTIVICYLEEIMSRDIYMAGIVISLIVFIGLIYSVIVHTKHFIIHFKTK
jgi:hypothetical protein